MSTISTSWPAYENHVLSAAQLTDIQDQAEEAIARLLDSLRIAGDEHSRATPGRVARMMVRELFAGRFEARPDVTTFSVTPSAADQIATVGPIALRSTCAHHLVPIVGQAWIGYLPGSHLVGLSKLHRLAHWVFSRPTIQEIATDQLAAEIERSLAPKGIGVFVRARHFCCSHRGVKDDESVMVTSCLHGVFRADGDARAELMQLIKAAGF